MDADGTLIKFGEIHDLVNRLHGIDKGRMGGVQFVNVGGGDVAVASGGIDFLDAIVADVKAADGSGHPTVLIAMIVDAAVLADVPAESHAFKESIFEDEIASVIAFREKNIFFKRFGTDRMLDDVVLDGLEIEIIFGDGGKAGDPIGDVGLPSDGDVLGHWGLRKRIARLDEL